MYIHHTHTSKHPIYTLYTPYIHHYTTGTEARRSKGRLGYDIELTTQKTKVNGVAAGMEDDACEGVQGKKLCTAVSVYCLRGAVPYTK